MIGQTIAQYKITAKLGEGGMGVVYRATDQRLHREVAIKVLPQAVAEDPDRLARFKREAQLLAALNHPSIAQVYGLEEHQGQHAIVLELVEGEDLSERIARGALSIEEARDVALQMTAALEAAHEKGIIHRDLKPANVKLAPDGTVKVLDFGLAKALAGEAAEADISHSPTMTAASTQLGVILGTASYMAPEQAKGKPVDRRADVWAFGCVLYEMLTGRKPFEGDGVSEVLAHVITQEPDFNALPANLPPLLGDTIRRCLRKDPRMRLPDIAAARIALVESDGTVDTTETPGTITSSGSGGSPGLPRGLAAAGIAGALVLGFLLGAWVFRGSHGNSDARPATVQAGIVALPESAEIAYGAAPIGYDSPMLAISADARSLVYVGRDGDGSRLYRMDLRSFDPPEPIPGTEGALQASFSPFGPAVAFYTNDKLARVDVTGDRLQVLGEVRSPTRLIWADDRKIYLGDAQASQLRVFPEGGGQPEDHGNIPYHGLSDVLPGGGRVLFHEKRTSLRTEFGNIQVLDLATHEERVVLTNAYDASVRGDRIFFIRDSALLSAPFDTAAAKVTGEPKIVVRDVAVDSIFGQAQFALSASGTLAYLPGGDRALGTIAWVDRAGKHGTLPVQPRVYGTLDISPDDRRIAVAVGEVRDYVWIYDIEKQTGRKLPSSYSAGWPTWNSAGDSITYAEVGEKFYLVEQPVDSRGEPRRICETPHLISSSSWTPDDSLLAFSMRGVSVVHADGKPAIDSFPGFMPDFSPDGRWMVYNSEQAGVYETIVRSWPEEDRAYSLQAEGGVESLWAANGELFWRLGNRWYVVKTTTGDTFSWTPPELAFEIPFLDTPGRSYGVTSDGQRLYTIVQADPDIVDRIHVISGGF